MLNFFNSLTNAIAEFLTRNEIHVRSSLCKKIDWASRLKVFCRKGVLRNSKTSTGKHMCQSLFFNKVTGLSPATSLKETLAQVFSYEFCEISKNTFFDRTPPVAASAS